MPLYARSQAEVQLEYKIVHIKNFASYFSWPSESNTEKIRLGIVGSQKLHLKIYSYYKNKHIKNKPVEVIKVPDDFSLLDYQILYIAPNQALPDSVLFTIHTKPTLTISDSQQPKNFIINYSIIDGKISYEVNPRAIEKAGLKVDYYFLKTSRIAKQ